MPTMMAAIASVMLTRNPGGSPWRNATTTLATSEAAMITTNPMF